MQWLRNYETGAISANAQLANGTPLGNVPLFPGLDKNGLLVNGGILWTTPTGFEFTFGYEGEYFPNTTSHTLSANLVIPIGIH